MRNDRVFAERLLRHVPKAGFIESKVAGGAAVDDAQFRQPDLMNARLEPATQAHGISAIVDQRQVVPLIVMPLAKVLLGGSNRESQQQDYTDNAECPHRVAEE